MQGENNYELEKSVSSDITGERDTRGFLMRACHELFRAQKTAKGSAPEIELSYYDIHLENLRDIGKYILDEMKGQPTVADLSGTPPLLTASRRNRAKLPYD